jgi:hypothetical protein
VSNNLESFRILAHPVTAVPDAIELSQYWTICLRHRAAYCPPARRCNGRHCPSVSTTKLGALPSISR